jgi:hypothetical protein
MKRTIVIAVFVFCTSACYLFSQQNQQEIDLFSGCPDPQSICEAFHPCSEVSNYCEGEKCFEMNYGDEIGLVASDMSGFFPKTWLVGAEKKLTFLSSRSCVVTKRNRMIKVTIPERSSSCTMTLGTSDDFFFEHFFSDPRSPCLAWIECRVAVDR